MRIEIDRMLLTMPQVRSITPAICQDTRFTELTPSEPTEDTWALSWGYPATKRRFGVAETGFFWDAMHIDTVGCYQFSSLNTAEGFRTIQDYSPPEEFLPLIERADLPQSKYRQPAEDCDWTGVVFACQNPSDRSIHSVASSADWWRFLEDACRYYGSRLLVKLHPWNRGDVEVRIRQIAQQHRAECGRFGHGCLRDCEHVVLFNSSFSVDCMVRDIPVKQGAPGYFYQTGAVTYCQGDVRQSLADTAAAARQLVNFLGWKYCFSMDCSLDDWKERLTLFAAARELFPQLERMSYAAYLRQRADARGAVMRESATHNS